MLQPLHAEQQLAAITAASAPYMSERGRRDLTQELSRTAGLADRRAARPKPADLAEIAALGITVEYEEAAS